MFLLSHIMLEYFIKLTQITFEITLQIVQESIGFSYFDGTISIGPFLYICIPFLCEMVNISLNKLKFSREETLTCTARALKFKIK